MFKDESNFKLFDQDDPNAVEDPVLPSEEDELEGENPEKGGLDDEAVDDPEEIEEEIGDDAFDTGRDE